MYIKDATKLFEQGKRSKSVTRDYSAKKQEAIAQKDAKKLERVEARIKEKTIDLFAMSLEACDLLGLPKDKCYDLYFRGSYIYAANLLRGMHVEGMMKILQIHRQELKIVTNTDRECKVEFRTEDGMICTHSTTIEEMMNTPWVKKEIETTKDGESLWETSPKEMLLHETVKFICKLMFRRFFKVRSKTIQNDFGLSKNHELAEDIFDEGIYDIESVDFNYLETFETLEMNGDEEAMRDFMTALRTKCVNKICASLDLCDATGLPKDYFYDVCKYEIYHEGNLAFNVKSCYAIDVLRHFGHVVRPENLSSKSAMIRYDFQGGEVVEHISLEVLRSTKAKIKAHLEDNESAWSNHTMLMLFYEVVSMAMKKCFAKVKVSKVQSHKRESNKRFLSKIQQYKQDPTPDLLDPSPDQQKQNHSDQESELPKSCRKLVIPKSLHDFMEKVRAERGF